jgi:hypothetical protein
MSTHDPTQSHQESAGLPPAPWVLCDRTSAEQIVTVLELLEQWLAGGAPEAADACARACSGGEADAETVAAWVGVLGARLAGRVEEADAWS